MDEILFDEIVNRIQNVYTNLFILAIKKRVNLKEIVELSTEKVKEYINSIDGFIPEGVDGLLFLSSASKMMDYSLFDVLYLSEKEIESILWSILDSIDIFEINSFEDLGEYYQFKYDFVFYDDEDHEIDFEFTFEDYSDICYISTDLYVDGETGFDSDFIYDSVFLWEGKEGRISRFIQSTSEKLAQSDLSNEAEAENEDEEIENQDTIIDYKDFFIHSNSRDCGHEFVKVMATVPIYSNWKVDTITFEADYCAECGVYYISEFTYRNKIVPNGRLLCQTMTLEEYSGYKKEMSYNGELKPQSILNILGYTVNSKDNLSEAERRTILKYAIESGIITKKLTIFYLQTFIKKGSSKKGLEYAVEKWKRDLQWVYNFEIQGDIIYGVKRVITNSAEGFMNLPE